MQSSCIEITILRVGSFRLLINFSRFLNAIHLLMRMVLFYFCFQEDDIIGDYRRGFVWKRRPFLRWTGSTPITRRQVYSFLAWPFFILYFIDFISGFFVMHSYNVHILNYPELYLEHKIRFFWRLVCKLQ